MAAQKVVLVTLRGDHSPKVRTGWPDWSFWKWSIKPCEDWPNIVGKQLLTVLDVVSVCTPCWMLLHVFACCYAKFETSQTFSFLQTAKKIPTCWEFSRPFARTCSFSFFPFLTNTCHFHGHHLEMKWSGWIVLINSRILLMTHRSGQPVLTSGRHA